MNYYSSKTFHRAGLGLGAAVLASPAGWPVMLIVALAFAIGFNPFSYGYVGDTSYPVPAGSTKSQITTAATRDEEVLWEHEVVRMAQQHSPFADNMTGGVGSGKPIVIKSDTTKVRGTAITITTVDPFGAPMIQGNATRVGNEEQVSPGDFQLVVNIGWFGAAIDNTGKAQTIIGDDWENISQDGLAKRLAKQQSDDGMINLKHAATSDNTVLPNGKTIDTLGTADTFQTSLIVKSSTTLSDLGAETIDARPVSMQDEAAGKIGRYMQFTSRQNASPIKTESAYLEGIKLAKERGETNNLFSGDFSEWDNNIVYPWQVVRHGGLGSIGAAVQPDALLGTAIVAKGTSTDLSAGMTGGGSTAKATATPLRNFFEFFSRYAYPTINGVSVTYNSGAASAVTGAFNPRDTYGYAAVVNATDGKIALFRYTTNGGNTLTGLKRLGSTSSGDYLTAIGDMTWGTAPWTTAADGAGYLGVTEGLLASGSKIYEVNSKGVPLGFGFGLGGMALVCGFGRIPLPGGGFKTMINRTEYIGPHNQNFGKGIEVCYGTAAFKRPDTITPNYTLNIFARRIDGFPVIA